MKLVGRERDYFFKGLRAERQAMGIAAFTYYRRVVDGKRGAIFDRIISVCQLMGGDADLVKDLEAAKRETRFTDAVKKITHALPQALRIKGEDPLTLLYAALSEGLHNRTDEECLQDAGDIRLVLTEFVERVDAALAEDKEMDATVKRLIERKNAARVGG
ncbi:hypothetical protein MW290_12940 [Aquincola tertiaricarbonis]|uniref:Uncharacterized protein n=1 Tax=Aquincola tertiaricarbonis TaxID=391953 RepID=A0ABY4S1I6_AQUTE|nr:hypothetical protein [Aquincola tertiaricarbonis]URI06799.1 hypothetical protein MW290_12940 [Aquincola tertiaricarbonis]